MAKRRKIVKFKVWHDEKNNVLRYDQNESLKANDIRKVTPLIEKLAIQTGLRCILIDLSKGPAATLDKEARKALKDAAMPDMFEKIAIYGANPAMRMIAKIIFKITGSSESTRFYKSEEEAIAWLKGQEV
ncbi:hypothetical protein GF359_00335 [candidate division WOR-3 bacterium]|uniref:STAS/SEC14 domain-containing protein n=1 Tax=candidate division WOR-3 bacterium TaxID=2052148 RepID=A0A9D5K8L8_UNCW3|nr:hypothetical protein [candidate division WOR-3 bacterium]MBD3363640.1 hypothetical protein [candidate division WOR-3 bacterium]